jgi:hypothetical protein
VIATSADDATEVRKKVRAILQNGRRWGDFWSDELLRPMNLDALATLP